MATTKKRDFEFMPIAVAAGVGMGAGPLMEMLKKNVFKKNPEMVPGAMVAMGIAIAYLGGKQLQPAAIALIAVSAGDLGKGLLTGGETGEGKMFDLSGFSRVNYLNGGEDFDLSGQIQDLDGLMNETVEDDGTYSEY